MEKIIYKNARINGMLTDIEITDGKFSFFGKTDADGTDLCGLDIFPGLIDIHCHGCLGHDAYSSFNHLEEMCIYMARNGITCWYPTLGSIPWEKYESELEKNYTGLKGAVIPGFHIEGPFVSGTALGSGSAENIKTPANTVLPYLESIKLVNVAPELDGALDFIKNTSAKVALGHTNADYNLAIKAIEAGADSLTHTFNAMPPLHHRDPGVIGAAIEKNIYAQVICDGIHIHKSVVIMLYKTFGKEKLILVSDAVALTGMPDGEYTIHGGIKRIVKDGAIRTESGRLAGSASNLYRDVLKAIEFGIPRDDAFAMASTTPAEYMGINKGKLKVGFDADFIAIDNNNALKFTVIGGKIFKE